jgi:hypothetical protein
MPITGAMTNDGSGLLRGDYKQNNYVVKAASTVRVGDVVKLDTGDVVENALALNASAASVTTSGGAVVCLGVALGNASAGETVAVAEFSDALQLKLRIFNATAANAEQQDVVIGTAYNLGRYTHVAGGQGFYVLTTGTTNPEFRVVEKSLDSLPADDYGFVWVKCVAAYRALA